MWIKVVVAFLVLIVALVAIDRLVAGLVHLSRASRSTGRGGKSAERGSRSGPGVLDVFQEIVQPEIRMVREDERQRVASIAVDKAGRREPEASSEHGSAHEEHQS